ncbi:uncharacterized protein LOC130654031 [Hydractinia symbiolongicarpus]|uniref:uncharacterized protein LOC130654031 n=1 Tax=Hydractinia symbiolongicarpus TaxID=13093 RepID=UPI002551542E|nr:uncharacterized protein LOC130654031 [Hydractinia symbiolongicarpus]
MVFHQLNAAKKLFFSSPVKAQNLLRWTRTFSNEDKTIRIGCASGFWGDTAVSAPQLVHHGNIDYLVFDYLSEITMSLLARAKQKNPEFGFAPDFVHYAVGPLIPEIKEKGIKVISNAGGINPLACARALEKVSQKHGVDLNIAVITGDDLLHKVKDIKNEIPDALPKGIHSMNAYLGAGPIARALDLGADVVITGRCVDSAVTLAPLIHNFKWKFNDYDLLAAGSLAGHLIECGAQVTGGIFTDWEMVPGWDNIGFPIVECSSDGRFIVTKPPDTGGIVNTATVSEQMVYEIDDPNNYLLPDVTCAFSDVQLEKIGGKELAVLVKGAYGKNPSDSYKVSATYLDGFRCTAVAPVIGPHAAHKGEKVANSILKRCQRIFHSLGLKDFRNTNVELLGSEGNYGKHRNNYNSREAVLWLAVEHEQKEALDIFAREIAPAGTGMAPGLTGIVGGRPTVSPILKLYSFLYPKSKVKIDIHMNDEFVETYEEPEIVEDDASSRSIHRLDTLNDSQILTKRSRKGNCTFPLGALAYTRSGDKGNNANIGVICRNAGYYPFLSDALTAEAVEKYFQHYFDREAMHCRVKRYDLPGIFGFNFVLENVLGGGGIASLRSDPQGKGLGQMLLDFKVKNVPDLLPSTSDRTSDVYGI